MNGKIILTTLVLTLWWFAQPVFPGEPQGTASSQAGNDWFGEPKCRQYEHETVCRVGSGGVTPPKLIWPTNEPVLHLDHASTNCPCTAFLRAVIEPDGHARHIRVNRSIDSEIKRKVIDYVGTWRFIPARNRYGTSSVAVEVDFEVPVR